MATAKKTPAAKTPAAKTAITTGTAVAVKKATSSNIVSIQEQLRAQAEAMNSKIAPPSGNAIRITQDKKFILPDGTKTEGPLDLVIIDFVSKSAYYEGAYNKDDLVPPNCFSISPEPRGMVPSGNSPDKQADDCASCPQNQWGSAATGQGKACKNGRVLAVLPPDADADTPLWTLAVSPTAIKGYDSFVAGVVRTWSAPPVAVVVTVGFSDASDYPSLTFTDPRPNDNLEVHFTRQAEATEMLAVEPDVSSFVKAAPAPARGAARSPARKVAPARR